MLQETHRRSLQLLVRRYTPYHVPVNLCSAGQLVTLYKSVENAAEVTDTSLVRATLLVDRDIHESLCSIATLPQKGHFLCFVWPSEAQKFSLRVVCRVDNDAVMVTHAESG